MKRCVILNEDFVASTIADVSLLLREAGRGRADWGEACRRLSEALPGSAVALVNYDMPRRAINAALSHGFDAAFAASYREHYVTLNPWLDFMADAQPGVVHVSERDFPARSFQDSEFYREWLAPQGNMDAAAGVRVRAEPHNDVQLAWHYDASKAGSYDGFAAAVLEGLKPHLHEAVQDAMKLRDGLEARHRLGLLIERIAGAAVLVDCGMRIRELNEQAATAVAAGQVMARAGDGTLSLRDPAVQRWLEEAVARLSLAGEIATDTMTFACGERIYRAGVTPAPDHAAFGFPLLFRPRPVALVVVRLLVGETVMLDHDGLRFAYGLSVAEIRLCETLMNGYSLAEAAAQFGLSAGTVRQRVKAIFHKTGTHRQGELVARLARFEVAGGS